MTGSVGTFLAVALAAAGAHAQADKKPRVPALAAPAKAVAATKGKVTRAAKTTAPKATAKKAACPPCDECP